MKSDVEATVDVNDLKGLALTRIRNQGNEGLLTFGYVRRCYNNKMFKNMQNLPFDLIKFVGKWICYETMHLIGKKGHWTIDMDKIILNSSQEMIQ